MPKARSGSLAIDPREISIFAEWPEKYTINAKTGCWIFGGEKLPTGYGRAKHDGLVEYAHRLFYRLHVGNIPDGFTIDHVYDRGCRSNACVNPTHLEAVSAEENTRRAREIETRLRGTCRAGLHSFPESRVVYPTYSFCRPCRNARRRELVAERRNEGA